MVNTRDDNPFCLVFTTLGNREDALRLVRHLVENRLAACGTILNDALSVYEWQGKLEEAPEVLVLLKTRQELWDAVQEAVRDLHPYEVPELLAVPVRDGLPAYLDWLTEQTTRERT